MQNTVGENLEEQKFLPDDLVSHRTWLIGRVVDIIADPEPGIIIDFPNKPNHRMNLSLAHQVLTKLPSEGLEVLSYKDFNKISGWCAAAPLKLIAAALTDLGNVGTPSQIKEVVCKHHLLGDKKWESWWKLIQPEVKKSPYFTYSKSKRTYTLLTEARNIPEIGLTSPPKKVRKATIGRDQVQEVVSELESGVKTLKDIKGEGQFRFIIKELVKRSKESKQAKQVIVKSLEGPVIPVRAILRELLEQERLPESMEYIVHLVVSIRNLVDKKAGEKDKSLIKHIGAKLNLLKESTEKLSGQIQYNTCLPWVLDYANALVDLSLSLCRRSITGWRSSALKSVSSTMAIVGKRETSIYKYAGCHLSNLKTDITQRLMVTKNLLQASAMKTNAEAVDALLAGSLEGSSDYARECVSYYISQEDRLEWISKTLFRISHPFDSSAVDTLAIILAGISEEVLQKSTGDAVTTAVTLSLLSPKAQSTLDTIIRSEVKVNLDSICGDTLTEEQEVQPGYVLGIIESTVLAKLEEEKQRYDSERKTLEAKISKLHNSLEKSLGKSAKLEDITLQLKTSFRLPEKWAEFEGKRGVLEGVARQYQELFLSREMESNREPVEWLLQRLLGLLQRHGVVTFASAGSRVTFDPSHHELLLGSKKTNDDVIIMCPGFEWQDPANNRIALVKAKVTGC